MLLKLIGHPKRDAQVFPNGIDLKLTSLPLSAN